MPNTPPITNAKTPWHFWLISIFGLLWNTMGATDYFMTQTRNQSYMSNFTPEQLAFFYGFPSWVAAAWAIAVWGGVLGALFLLAKKKIAEWILLASWLAVIVTFVHNYGFSDGMQFMGDPVSLSFTVAVFLIALGLYLYTKTMSRRGVLR